jgi:hypothetical protein
MELPEIGGVLAFIKDVELPDPPRRRNRAVPDDPASTNDQAIVVGSSIVSFVNGVAPEHRSAIMNCSLLAQLAANRKVPDRAQTMEWYNAYFDILSQLGWVIQDRRFSRHVHAGDDFEAHKAILSVAATVLGGTLGALAVVESTLDAMKEMSDGVWVTIFQKQSQSANTARFQVTVAEPAAGSGVVISMMAFELDARNSLTQILFFKFRSADVELRHAATRMAIDGNLLTSVAPVVAQRVIPYVNALIENIPL